MAGSGSLAAVSRLAERKMASKLNGIALIISLAVILLATFAEGHYTVLGNLIWPGAGLSFLLFLILHLRYFDHPTAATCLDVIFNTLIYWGIFLIAKAVYLRVRRRTVTMQ
jgi:hypothetical protein